MSDAEQRCFELVQVIGEQQRSMAAVLVAAELWAARVDTLPVVSTTYADRLVAHFVELREASHWWQDTMRWVVSERWGGKFDLRAATDLDGVLSDVCAKQSCLRFDGTLAEGGVVLQDLRVQQASFEAGLRSVKQRLAEAAVPEPSAISGLTLMLFATMKAQRAVREAYSDLAQWVHEPCLGLSAAEPTFEAAVDAGAFTIASWMEVLETGGFDAAERAGVLRERERAYLAPGYELGAPGAQMDRARELQQRGHGLGAIRAASIAAFRERTWEQFGRSGL